MVSAQQVLITIMTQWFMKDKRTDLKLHFNYTAGWVFAIVFFPPLQLMRKGLKKQQWFLKCYLLSTPEGLFSEGNDPQSSWGGGRES